jgi:hypothetical protein
MQTTIMGMKHGMVGSMITFLFRFFSFSSLSSFLLYSLLVYLLPLSQPRYCMILCHVPCLFHNHLKLEDPHFLTSCLENHLLPSLTYLFISLTHLEVVLTLKISMQGMLTFDTDV